MIVHGVCGGSQPYIAFYCNSKQEHYVSFQSGTTPPDVHECDVNDKRDGLYTFSDSKITCPECLDIIKNNKLPS